MVTSSPNLHQYADIPPVMTIICSPQSNGPGPYNKLPWLRYKREYHFRNPEAEYTAMS